MYCKNGVGLKSCISCDDCDICSECTYCNLCIRCRKCRSCLNCVRCNSCSACILCKDCLRCFNCDNGNTLSYATHKELLDENQLRNDSKVLYGKEWVRNYVQSLGRDENEEH
jgi:hypothetical protein